MPEIRKPSRQKYAMVRIPEILAKRIRIAAKSQGRTFADTVRESCRKYMDQAGKA